MIQEVTHNNETYTFDSESTSPALVEYLRDGALPYPHQFYYEFELRGAHDGPPIKVRMIDPNYEWASEGGGISPTWHSLLFADDLTEIENSWILDFYTEALGEELGEIIKETWD